jgi:hypothetical protein
LKEAAGLLESPNYQFKASSLAKPIVTTEPTITEEPTPAEGDDGQTSAEKTSNPPAESRTEETVQNLEEGEQPESDATVEEPREAIIPAKRTLSRPERQTYDRVVRRFQVCGRCSYLLADFRLALGEETLQSAILKNAPNDWLELSGPETIRLLLVNAFGIDSDLVFDHYDGLCPECRRRVILSAENDGVIQVKIQI